MNKINSFKLFLEGYSDDVKEVLTDEDNNYVVMQGDNISGGFNTLAEAISHLGELLKENGAIDEDQAWEFEETSVDDDNITQYDIDQIIEELLDKFRVVEPYSIQNRVELEETPLDPTLDDDWNEEGVDDWDTDEQESDDDEEQEYAEMLESDAYCIAGMNGNKLEEIDSFQSEEEANSYLDDYRKIYNTHDDLKIIHRDELTIESNEDTWLNDEDDDQGCCDLGCSCIDEGKCVCGSDCECPECRDLRTHQRHCNQGDYEGSCKYGDDNNCPALRMNESGEYGDIPGLKEEKGKKKKSVKESNIISFKNFLNR